MTIMAVYSKPQVLKTAERNVIMFSTCIGAVDHEHGLIFRMAFWFSMRADAFDEVSKYSVSVLTVESL